MLTQPCFCATGHPTACVGCANFARPLAGMRCTHGGKVRPFKWSKKRRSLVVNPGPCKWFSPKNAPPKPAKEWRPYAD